MTAAENPENADLRLASWLAQGDPAAAAELVERYADDLYRFVYHQVGGVAQDTEDIVQETLVAALSAISRFRGDSKLRTWLFSIAAHKIADLQRRSGRNPEPASLDILSSSLYADSLSRGMSLTLFCRSDSWGGCWHCAVGWGFSTGPRRFWSFAPTTQRAFSESARLWCSSMLKKCRSKKSAR